MGSSTRRGHVDAKVFAKRYTELVEALMTEGVPEMIAREEARMAAMALLLEYATEDGERCPMCGRSG